MAQLDPHAVVFGRDVHPVVEGTVEQVVLVGHDDPVGTAVRPLLPASCQGVGDDGVGDLLAELHRPGEHPRRVPVLAGVEALGLVPDEQQRRVGRRPRCREHVDLHRPQALPDQVERLRVDCRAEHRGGTPPGRSPAEPLVVPGVVPGEPTHVRDPTGLGA
ncbi:hypothetical protein [Actinosynnema sp. NPDC023587]|uniref:hypothetical protein n=1 Tax=Actinosynnema sp. NPDC023587 TaxID=3154695 RepID=UPI0033C7C395